MRRIAILALSLSFMTACAANHASVARAPEPSPAPAPIPEGELQARFDAAMAAFIAHDRAGDWSAKTCAEVAAAFDALGTPQATMNAGLAYQRCGDDAKARDRFEKGNARTQLALYRFKDDKDVDAAIRALSEAVTATKFQDVGALVTLATFEMQRGTDKDLDDAKLNLQRALAIDDAYMPALNQLALFYMKIANKKQPASVQQLELAALVCAQAIKKNAAYAPVHNTLGLIEYELGHVNGAVSEFTEAARLDPNMFEAHMNQARVNLGFRGFDHARAAFEKAIALRPNDYDAHLGLALALRGALTGTESDADQRIAAVQRELDTAKKIDPNRPEAYFNEGVLVQEFKAKTGGDKERTRATLNEAKRSFERFLEKANGNPSYDAAVKNVRSERLGDITKALEFL